MGQPSKENSSDSCIELIELLPEEVDLIRSIRKNWRFGEIVIMVRDGKPYRLRRVTEFIELGQKAVEK